MVETRALCTSPLVERVRRVCHVLLESGIDLIARIKTVRFWTGPTLDHIRTFVRGKRASETVPPIASSPSIPNNCQDLALLWRRVLDRSWRKLNCSPHRTRSEPLHPQPWRLSDYLIHFSARSEQPRVVQHLPGDSGVHTTRTTMPRSRHFPKPSQLFSPPHMHMSQPMASPLMP